MLKPLPMINPDRIEFDANEIGFTLKLSDETIRDLEEIDRNLRNAMIQSRRFYFD